MQVMAHISKVTAMDSMRTVIEMLIEVHKNVCDHREKTAAPSGRYTGTQVEKAAYSFTFCFYVSHILLM